MNLIKNRSIALLGMVLTSVFLSSVLSQFFPNYAQAEPSSLSLSDEDWQDIRSASDAVGVDVNDFLISTLYRRDICGDGGEVCVAPLSKRENDFHIILAGGNDFLDHETPDVAHDELIETLYDFKVNSGISALFSKPNNTNTFIYIVFVNEKVFHANPELYLQARITRKSFGQAQKRRDLFETFISGSSPCTNNIGIYSDGILRDAHVWIRVDLEPQEMRSCIRTSLAGAFGVDAIEYSRAHDLSLGREPNLTMEIEVAATNAVLKLLYSDIIPEDASPDEAKVVIERLKSQFRR